MNATRSYAATERETASRERLMMLLFHAALRHMRRGTVALEQARRAEANAALSRAGEIVVELHATLDPVRAPELAERLGEIYRFVCLRLGRANLSQDPAPAREAERAFAPIVEAFAASVAALTPPSTEEGP